MEKKNVPKIRFPGFTEPWEQRKLGEITERVTRKNTNLESTLPLTISAQYGLVDQITFFNKRVASKDLSNYLLIKKGEFAYNKSYSDGYPFGAIKRLERYDMGVLSSLYIIFKPNNKIINSDYLTTYYDTNCWHKQVSDRAAEGARNHGLLNISSTDFFDTELKFPKELKEQEQIGNFFKQIDNLISLHHRKLENLKKQKKGLLQKMFPEKGKKVPEIRFPEFTNDWEQRKLFDVIIKIIDFRGRTPKKLGMDWSEDGYLALSALNVKNGYIDPKVEAHYGNQELYDKWMSGNELHEGQVLFTTEAPMGNVAQIPDSKKYILSQRTIAFEVNKNKISENYLSVVLRSPSVFNKLKSLSSGGTATGISQKSLSEIDIFMPINLEEQRKISHYFLNLDNLITLHQRKLEHLQKQKKALLQQMFV